MESPRSPRPLKFAISFDTMVLVHFIVVGLHDHFNIRILRRLESRLIGKLHLPAPRLQPPQKDVSVDKQRAAFRSPTALPDLGNQHGVGSLAHRLSAVPVRYSVSVRCALNDCRADHDSTQPEIRVFTRMIYCYTLQEK